MKKAVHDDPIEFLGENCPVVNCVVTDCIDADEQVSGQQISLAVIKSDDVREGVALQIFLVDLKKISI